MVYTPGKVISTASTNLTQIKASAGYIGYLAMTNNGASNAYIKLYDAANPVVGTDIPVHTFEVPRPGSNIPLSDFGINFRKAIWLAITGGIADSDSTAVAAGQVIVNYGCL
jgi:hypothetical protein